MPRRCIHEGRLGSEWALSSASSLWGFVFLHPAWFLLGIPLFGGLWQTVAAVVAMCLCVCVSLSLSHTHIHIPQAQKMHSWGEIILNSPEWDLSGPCIFELVFLHPAWFWFDSHWAVFFGANSTRCCRVFRELHSHKCVASADGLPRGLGTFSMFCLGFPCDSFFGFPPDSFLL